MFLLLRGQGSIALGWMFVSYIFLSALALVAGLDTVVRESADDAEMKMRINDHAVGVDSMSCTFGLSCCCPLASEETITNSIEERRSLNQYTHPGRGMEMDTCTMQCYPCSNYRFTKEGGELLFLGDKNKRYGVFRKPFLFTKFGSPQFPHNKGALCASEEYIDCAKNVKAKNSTVRREAWYSTKFHRAASVVVQEEYHTTYGRQGSPCIQSGFFR